MRPRLYVIPASPPCACVEAALRLKGVAYDVTELPPVAHVPHQLLRFGVPTVPTMTLDGEKVAGSRAITRRIDALWPDPPLYGRPGVEEAEAWGDHVLQPVGRRLVWWAMGRAHASMPSFLADSRLPMPPALARILAPVTAPVGGWRNGSSAAKVRADVHALPDHLARIERWIDDGTIGTGAPTAADLQIGAVLGILLAIEDVARIVEDRSPRAAALSRRWFPHYPGHVPAGVLPAGGS